MPRYVTLFSYTSESVRSMIDNPTDRLAAAKALVESMGGTLEAFYWMHGAHDGLLISNLPDGVTAAALSAAAGSTGAIAGLETHELFDPGQQADIVTKAKLALAAYKPPTD